MDNPFVFDKGFSSALQQLQFVDKYARWNSEKGRRETWAESIERSVNYLREISENKLPERDYERIQEYMLEMKAFPSMRLFAMAGPAARRQNVAIYNCSYCPIDSIDAFVEVLTISMAGCGVGFSVENRYASQLPPVQFQREGIKSTFLIPDSTEGWCEAFKLGLENWFNGRDARFDYSLIRPAGAVLKTKGGRASGPEPLQRLLNFARKTILNAQGRKLTPLEVYDLTTMIGDCAVSGGSRRSAQICLFDFSDDEMLHAKDDGWWRRSPQRSNANNSFVVDRHLTRDEIGNWISTMHESKGGEPGIFSRLSANITKPERRESAVFGTNPLTPSGLGLATA